VIVLDADIVTACMEHGHVHAARALEVLVSDDDLIIHPLTLAECAVGAVDKGHESILRLLVEQVAVWSPDPGHSRRVEHLRAATSLNLLECCALDVAEHENATLATFDARLAQVARIRTCPVLTLTAASRPAELT